MDPNEQKQISQIASRLLELEDLNAALTRRVFFLETEIGKVTGTPVVPVASPPRTVLTPPPLPVDTTVPEPLPLPSAELPPPLLPAATEAGATAVEGNVGLAWINRIGVLTLILGVAFFFKYMVDNDWIGPAGRVILGVLAGMLTIFAGDRLWHRDQKTFAQGVQALGISILYLSFFAAFRFYELIPQSVAFVLLVLTTAMTGALALRYNARATLLLGLFGGYATPFLLSKGEPNDLFFLSYMLLLNAGAATVARKKDWKSVETVAFIGTWILHFAWTENRGTKVDRLLGAGFTALNYGLFVASEHPWISFLAQMISGVVLGYGFRDEWNSLCHVLCLVHFGVGLFIAHRRNFYYGARAALAGFWLGQLASMQPNMAQHLTVVLSVHTAVFAATLAFTVSKAARGFLNKFDLVAAAVAGVAYFGAGHVLLVREYQPYLGLFAVAVAASYLALGYLLRRHVRDSTTPLVAAGLALAFLALAVPIQFSGNSITLGWAIQAAALSWIAYKLKDARVLIGSAALYFLAISRLTAEDSQLYWPPIDAGYTLFFNPRFLTYFCVCLSLWISAWFTSKFEEKWLLKAAGLAYIAGHFFMILGLHLEFFAYIDSRKDFTSPDSLKTLISSIILAGYGFLFISFGFARRAALPRVLGLLLFAVVVLKLYLYDIWLLDRIYRMIAFIALGAILLGGSYLYSRFRDKLGTLIREPE